MPPQARQVPAITIPAPTQVLFASHAGAPPWVEQQGSPRPPHEPQTLGAAPGTSTQRSGAVQAVAAPPRQQGWALAPQGWQMPAIIIAAPVQRWPGMQVVA